MVFLHINDETKMDELNKLNSYIKDDKKNIFLLIFMNGCGPCEATKPEWKNIESTLDDKLKKDENIVIADLEQSLLKSLKNLPKQPSGFPTMYYITDGGKTCEDFNSGRDVNSFIKWIESNVEAKQKGGKKHNKKSNKSKKSKSKKSKKSKKSNKSKKSKKRNQHSRKRNKK
jgi:hypothetical protein